MFFDPAGRNGVFGDPHWQVVYWNGSFGKLSLRGVLRCSIRRASASAVPWRPGRAAIASFHSPCGQLALRGTGYLRCAPVLLRGCCVLGQGQFDDGLFGGLAEDEADGGVFVGEVVAGAAIDVAVPKERGDSWCQAVGDAIDLHQVVVAYIHWQELGQVFLHWPFSPA